MVSGDAGVIRNENGRSSRTASRPPNTTSRISLSQGGGRRVCTSSWRPQASARRVPPGSARRACSRRPGRRRRRPGRREHARRALPGGTRRALACGRHEEVHTRRPPPWLKEILDVVFGGREAVRELRPFSFLITPASPLTIEKDFTGSWLALRDYGVPVAIMPMPLQGATAPGSRLAAILTANCETIGTLCLVQAAAPGTPVLYAPVIATMDPRTGLYAAGAIEHAVLCAAGTEMARYYGLPAESSGFCTQHYEPDLQTAWEKANGGLLVALSNPDVLVGPGLLGGATILSLEQIVLDVEVSRIARQARAGVPVRDDLWLDDALAGAGPCGSFLGERSTRANVRAGEWWLSDFGVYGSWDAWKNAGSPSSLDYARERVDHILETHRPLPLPDDTIAALAAIHRRALAAS